VVNDLTLLHVVQVVPCRLLVQAQMGTQVAVELRASVLAEGIYWRFGDGNTITVPATRYSS
jgi:hypothetical protein